MWTISKCMVQVIMWTISKCMVQVIMWTMTNVIAMSQWTYDQTHAWDMYVTIVWKLLEKPIINVNIGNVTEGYSVYKDINLMTCIINLIVTYFDTCYNNHKINY